MFYKWIGVYIGIDLMVFFLYIGYLFLFMLIFWMYMYGYVGYILIGGVMVKIGDFIDWLVSCMFFKRIDFIMNLIKIYY